MRTLKLNALGYEVIRFTNDEVIESPQKIADKIKEYLDNKKDYCETVVAAEDYLKSSFSPPLEGSGEVGRVWINDEQYFEGVPLVAWEFYIGGYQPAQKWLKDRKGRQLTFEEILHYQKIIVALSETERIMSEIDLIEFE